MIIPDNPSIVIGWTVVTIMIAGNIVPLFFLPAYWRGGSSGRAKRAMMMASAIKPSGGYRAMVAAVLWGWAFTGAVLLSVLGAASRYEDTKLLLGAMACSGLALGGVALQWLIAMYNRPTFLVPRRFRNELGSRALERLERLEREG